jgi:hypothetical protein
MKEDVVEVSVDRTEGDRDGDGEVADIAEPDIDCTFDTVEGVVRRKGPFVRRLRAKIEELPFEDILCSSTSGRQFYRTRGRAEDLRFKYS